MPVDGVDAGDYATRAGDGRFERTSNRKVRAHHEGTRRDRITKGQTLCISLHSASSATLKLILEGFGNPHAHSGLAIRKLGKHLYECRTGLAWRLVFEAQKGILTFDFAGDHDEVQNYLRGKR